MGRLSRSGISLKSEIPVLELNEANVQKVFNECLISNQTQKKLGSTIFSRLFGYSEKEESHVDFDEVMLKKNNDKIQYLLGQLYIVHNPKNKQGDSQIDIQITDFDNNYVSVRDKYW